MKRIVIYIFISSILFITNSCTKESSKNIEEVNFTYKVLYEENYSFKKGDSSIYKIGAVYIDFLDTGYSAYHVHKAVKQICLEKNFIAVKFYKNIDTLKIGQPFDLFNDHEDKSCIGYIDLRNRGRRWKSAIRLNDIYFYHLGTAYVSVKL